MLSKILKRNIHTLSINGVKERIFQRSDFPPTKYKEILGKEVVSIIGYGPQGRGQALNLKDNGIDVMIGLRQGNSWNQALEDGWEPNKNLFSIHKAIEKSTFVQYLLSDAGQMNEWNNISHLFDSSKTLCFSHGFGITFNDKTGIVPPKDMDVILIAPKGAGSTVRNKFIEGSGINSSYAVHQDVTGNAADKALSLAFAVGSGHVFETTFEKEVFSDLTGERCVLMGLIQGAFLAQYNVLRKEGHSPSESYNETVEEALVSLYPLISDKGMDWLYANCSTTAQRGALDWAPRFADVLEPVIQECYDNVKSGKEADIVISSNSDDNYRDKLNEELDKMGDQELWKVGKLLRGLRP